MDSPRILVVDDEVDLCDSIRRGLEIEGFQVEVAYDGYSALGAVRANPPDLIILDVMLPQQNGYEVSRMIKEDIAHGVHARPIPIIILTARVLSSSEREEFVRSWSQAEVHMYKPFDMAVLVTHVKRLLATAAHDRVTNQPAQDGPPPVTGGQ
jgi:DNA-binding response OmpR family regulator